MGASINKIYRSYEIISFYLLLCKVYTTAEVKIMRKASLSQIFFQMLKISAVTFGGGFVIVTLMKRNLSEKKGWLSEQEILDMTALAQSAPGSVSVNSAVQVGWHLAGLPGMLAAVAGCILPPMVILSVISLFYDAFLQNQYLAWFLHGMLAGAAAVVLDVTFSLGKQVLTEYSVLHTGLLAGAFLLNLMTDLNPVFLLLAGAAAGMYPVVAQEWKEKRRTASHGKAKGEARV